METVKTVGQVVPLMWEWGSVGIMAIFTVAACAAMALAVRVLWKTNEASKATNQTIMASYFEQLLRMEARNIEVKHEFADNIRANTEVVKTLFDSLKTNTKVIESLCEKMTILAERVGRA